MNRSAFSLSPSERAFLLRFFLCFFALYLALLALDFYAPALTLPAKSFVAQSELVMLRAAGFPVSLDGLVIHSQGSAYLIVVECTGLVLVMLLFSLLFASRLHKKKLFSHFVPYSVFLFAFNIVRVLLTISVGLSFGDAALDAVHVSLWLFDSLLVLWLWMRTAGIRVGKIAGL